MFLILNNAYYCLIGNNNSICSILSFIETHPVLMGGLIIVPGGLLWWQKFIRQKRAEAFFGFYTQLLLQIKNLRSYLEEKNWLDENGGNIYALMYIANVINDFSVSQSNEDLELTHLCSLVTELKKTLLESDNNVYPKVSSIFYIFKKEEVDDVKKSWYDSQATILSFCNFILNKNEYHKIDSNNYKYNHTIKCIKLIEAMDTLQSLIEESKY